MSEQQSGTPSQLALFHPAFAHSKALALGSLFSLLLFACASSSSAPPSGGFTITSGTPLAGALDADYQFQLQSSGGTPPIQWSIAQGTLPAGLSLNPSTGLISGMPTRAGTATFTVEAIDGSGASVMSTQLVLTVAASAADTDAGSSDTDAGATGADAGSTGADAGDDGGGASTGGSSGSADGGLASGSTDGGVQPDPTLLPTATTAQAPLTAAYDALDVPALAAGETYPDPTTGVKIYKLTSSSFPTASATWNHDYSEGGDEVSLPYNGDGQTRAVLVRAANSTYWLLDFKPGVGVSNPRQLSGSVAPFMDLAFAFSNNPATPYYAYVSNGTAINRVDIRTLTEAPGDNWPQTGETDGCWLHQSANDGMFVWMRGSTGDTVVIYQPSTNTKKTYVNSLVNEPRMDRAGGYVGIDLDSPSNALAVWDWNLNGISWTTPGDPGIPFAHCASQQGRWVCVDWNLTFPGQFSVFLSATPNSQYLLPGPANGTLVHGSGNWIQYPADPDDQWAIFDSYDGLQPQPTTVAWLAPGGMVFVNANGGRRLLGHEYNTSSDYTLQGFAKPSSDGRYVLFASDMDGSSRTDVFLAEMPVQ